MEIGVDITSVSRFLGKADKLAERILTATEREMFAATGACGAAEFVAKRWAAKEAVYKVTQDRKYLRYSVSERDGEYSVDGRPDIKLSVCCDGDTVIAVALKRIIYRENIS